ERLMKSLSVAEAEEDEPAQKLAAQKPIRHVADGHQFELSANAIDLDSILGDFDSPPPPPRKPHAGPQEAEVDISLDEIKPGAAAAPPPPPQAARSEDAGDLDAVFGNMRDQAARRSGLDDAEKDRK